MNSNKSKAQSDAEPLPSSDDMREVFTLEAMAQSTRLRISIPMAEMPHLRELEDRQVVVASTAVGLNVPPQQTSSSSDSKHPIWWCHC